jgi:putative phosphoesterase
LRIGIISDIHGNLPGLRASWNLLTELEVDSVICLGDLVHYGPFPSEVVEFVRQRGIDTVQGNCDRAVARGRDDTGDEFDNIHWRQLAQKSLQWTTDNLSADQRKYLRKLPVELRYKFGRSELLCVHGLPGNISGRIQENSTNEVYGFLLERNFCQVLALGHTHEMFLRSVRAGLILNPGSVGGGTLPGESTFSVLSWDEETRELAVCWHRVPFDAVEYENRYRSAGLPETFLKCVLLGRDPRGKWLTSDINRRQRWAET